MQYVATQYSGQHDVRDVQIGTLSFRSRVAWADYIVALGSARVMWRRLTSGISDSPDFSKKPKNKYVHKNIPEDQHHLYPNPINRPLATPPRNQAFVLQRSPEPSANSIVIS